MTFPVSGRSVDIKCTELILSEFPNLLFGDIIDKGKYFDAFYILQKHNPSLKAEDFFDKFGYQINTIQKDYGIVDEDVCYINSDGHLLIHSSFSLLFLSFAIDGFLSYSLERIYEMFETGFCVSDTVLIDRTRNRIDKETIERMVRDV